MEEILRLFTFKNPYFEKATRFSPSGYISKDIPEFLYFAVRKGKDIRFPRGIYPPDLSEEALQTFNRINWLDLRTRAKVKFPSLQIGLNREQRIILRHFNKDILKKNIPFGNYLFVKPTSTGKTITQAEIARATKQRTLVICVTNLIKNAWLSDLRAAYGLSSKDIGLIQQKTWRIGKWFTIASIGTIRKRKHLWSELFEEFGCVILDEAHTVTQPSLFTFLMSHPALYLIGATATDKKDSGKNNYLLSTFGKVRKRITAQQKETETSLPLSDVRNVNTDFEYEYQDQNLDIHDLQEHIISDEMRNAIIVENAYQDWKRGHSILVTTYRLAHVELLKEMLEEKGVNDINILTGKQNIQKDYSRKLIRAVMKRKCCCVIATVQAVLLGANLNPIDRLHPAMPILNRQDLEQLIGRSRRKAKGKTDVVLVYYLDRNVPYLMNVWKRKAMSVFRKLKVPKYQDVYML
jgi:superfamily II DNA or RNA helicase